MASSVDYSNSKEIIKFNPRSYATGNLKDGINMSTQEFNNTESYIEVNITTYPLKITFIGNSGVGKSSIVTRFCDNKFKEGNVLPTTSSFFVNKKIKIDPYTEINFEIWDTAGQERFRSMSRSYLRESNGIFLVFDLTDQKSFEDLNYWMEEIKLSETKKNCIKILIGNKFDCEDKGVEKETIDEFIKENNNMKYLNVSAKDGVNIETMFEMMGIDCVKKIRELGNNIEDENNITIKKKEDNGVKISAKKTKKKKNQKCC